MATNGDGTFLPQQGNYENLMVYKLAGCIYAITHHFANTYFERGDRTIDQMVQAARSGKQNIAEGIADGVTSREMELKLLNVARGSMQEVKADFEDYLLHHSLERWHSKDPRTLQVRRFSYHHMKPEEYLEKAKQRSAETVANIALTLIHRYDYMMVRLLATIQRRFVVEGGIKEAMYRARTQHRDNPNRTDKKEDNNKK